MVDPELNKAVKNLRNLVTGTDEENADAVIGWNGHSSELNSTVYDGMTLEEGLDSKLQEQTKNMQKYIDDAIIKGLGVAKISVDDMYNPKEPIDELRKKVNQWLYP